MTNAIARRRALLASLFDRAVARAHPQACLPPFLPPPPASGRLMILAAGKAGGAMAAVAEQYYLAEGLRPDRLSGIAVTRHGYGAPTQIVEMREAGHPVPDQAGLDATRAVLALADQATADHLVLVLLSGGGSANWIAPAGRLTLAEKQAITKDLLRSGADIHEINTLRKHLSLIKGGRLAARLAPAQVVTLAISDVPHDDPATIASGPTVPDPTTNALARAIATRRSLILPPAAQDLLDDPANETPKPGDPVFARTTFEIIARPADAIAAAAAGARKAGYEPIVLGADLEGEARAVAGQHARLAREIKSAGRRAAIISGGELTVTITGDGRGGPSQEYALALALSLNGEPGISALAGDTDGSDGGRGAADDPAGAFIDETTLERARGLGLDPAAFLAKNDSTSFFARLGDLLQPGPTRTNANDCRIVLIEDDDAG